LDLLLELNRAQSVTLVMVTHDVRLARQLDRHLHVEDGRIHG
jgi:predicted ABC-type transport system involved in lysophospholipase L1 biosynthesis ATPase subunit